MYDKILFSKEEFNSEIKKINLGMGKYKASNEKIILIILYFLQNMPKTYFMDKNGIITNESRKVISTIIHIGTNLKLNPENITNISHQFIIVSNIFIDFLHKSINENAVLEIFLQKLKDIDKNKPYDKNTYIKELEQINKVFLPKSKYKKEDLLKINMRDYFLIEKNHSNYENICVFINFVFNEMKTFLKECENSEFLFDVLIYYAEPPLTKSERSQILRYLINKELSALH